MKTFLRPYLWKSLCIIVVRLLANARLEAPHYLQPSDLVTYDFEVHEAGTFELVATQSPDVHYMYAFWQKRCTFSSLP